MTLPSSGQLDFNSIRAEFSGPSSNVTMSTYNRGGTYVFAVPANADIPTGTTDTIEIPDFYGAKNKSDYAQMRHSEIPENMPIEVLRCLLKYTRRGLIIAKSIRNMIPMVAAVLSKFL